MTFEAVPYHGTPHNHAGAGGRSLKHAKKQQLAKVRGHGAAYGRCDIDHQAYEDDGTAAERVGQRAVKQRHDREGQEIDAQRLL